MAEEVTDTGAAREYILRIVPDAHVEGARVEVTRAQHERLMRHLGVRDLPPLVARGGELIGSYLGFDFVLAEE